ncbi:phage holin family protein [Actinocrispum sp. NPDC049592]|uniref:phage holin family protein n=1 Tax=Actinocrispum sp. NPDC049592 TaxID=3154835 RepID=UPI003440CF5C
MSIKTDDRSVSQLVSDASEQLSRLVRDEMRLAAAELRQKGKRAGIGAGMFGAAGVLALLGAGALVATAILALALVMAAWLAALLVGAALLVIALVAALIGKSQVSKATPPVPEEAAASVKNDIAAVREGVHR